MRTKWNLALVSGAIFVCLGGAAKDADLSGFFGNTLQVTTPQGVMKVYMDANGGYTQALPNGAMIKGMWTDDGSQTCYSVTEPAPPAGAKPICVASVTHKVGDSWTVTDPSGATMQVVLLAGKQ